MGFKIKLPFLKAKKSLHIVSIKKKTDKPLREAIKLLDSSIVDDKFLGSERLLLLNDPKCIPVLINHLEPTENRKVLENVFKALRNFKDIRATEKLIRFVESYPQLGVDNSLVSNAIDVLGDSKDPRSPDFIYSILKEYQSNPATTVIYMSTIHQLGNLKYKKAFNEIFKFIPDKSVNKYLREYALEAVLKINRKKAIKPLLNVFNEEEVDWPFRRKIISSIIYSGNGKPIKELKNCQDDVDPYIRESVGKYLSGEKLSRFNEAKETPKKRKRKYLITNDWWHDIIEYRRWINDLFKVKFKVKGDVFQQNELIIRDLQKDCKSESDFTTLVLNLASQIDTINGNVLNPFISVPPQKGQGSINTFEAFLIEKIPSYNPKIASNLRIIHRIRSKKLPVHITSELPNILILLGFYTFPPEWEKVWEKLKDIYIEALKLLKESLEKI